ncbi:MAG: HD domain-containing protein [Firmicutes bacterium]|nr:HD domain-containing protein [Bacillota bacterium]
MTRVIRDCVHGDIELTPEQIRILDTPQMQRLRGIKQLGTAYLVYPTALHTRFDHCVGTSWLAGRMLDMIAKTFRLHSADRRVISIAALVHDVSHVPFGHTFEDERRVFERHDLPYRLERALDRGDLGKTLRRMKLLEPVISVLTGACQSVIDFPEQSYGYGREIVSGPISADLADYLKRDAWFCGLSQSYDERVFRYLEIDACGRLVFRVGRETGLREDALSEIINLLRMRYFLSERVYYHHTKVAAGAMISKAVEVCASQGRISLERLEEMDDWSLLHNLESSDLPLASKLAKMVRTRSLYKRSYILYRKARPRGSEAAEEVVSRLADTYHYDSEARNRAELALCRECGLSEGDLIIYCPSPDMQLKEANVPIVGGEPGVTTLSEMAGRGAELQVLLEAHRRLWRFYVFASPQAVQKMKAVSRACEEFFGFANEYPDSRKGD